MRVKIKICGISEEDNIKCCIDNSVDMIGFVSKYDIQIIKAININEGADKAQLIELQNNMDYLLFDAPPPEDTMRPGGNGNRFDWNLIKNFKMDSNWILSGGLSPENIGDAIKITGANFVDVSSGVENDVGIKDNDLITKFIYNARNYMEKN